MPPKIIQREPDFPTLNEEAIKLLTTLVFRQNDALTTSDILFVFGTRKNATEAVAHLQTLLNSGMYSKVLLTSGKGEHDLAESALILELVDPSKYPGVTFYTEDQSTTTLANVTEALKVFDLTACKTITFVFKAHATGRGYLTLRILLPNTTILQAAYPVVYDEIVGPTTASNWHSGIIGTKHVWGEYLRIKKYGKRGDIEFNEVADLVHQIEVALTLE